MTADRDITRIVRSWLGTDEHENADRILETVLSRLDTTPQRRRRWPARRFTIMINGTRLAIGTAAVLLVAVLGYSLLPRQASIGGPAPTAAPTPTPSPTPVPALLADQPVLDGRYWIPGLGSSDTTVAVPATGWTASGGWVVVGPQGNQSPTGMAIRFFTATNLVKDPAAPDQGFLTPAVGPTVDDLVQAIVTHPAWTASTPSNVTLDGYAGQKVSITIPLDAPLASDGNFYTFDDGGGANIYGWQQGQVFEEYIVDVNGQRVIIEAFHYPGTSAADLAAQQAVVDSVQFDPKP